MANNHRAEEEKKKREDFWKQQQIEQIHEQPKTENELLDYAFTAATKTNKRMLLLRKRVHMHG